MRRLLLIPLGVAILGGVAFGAPRVAVVFLPFALGVLVWATVAHRTTVPDPGWASSTRVPAPAAGPAPVAASPGQTGESTPIVRALVGVEGRLLLTSAAFAVGLGFCALLIALFVFVWGGENTTPWSENLQTMPWLVHPLVGMTVLASHRAVTRGSRDRVDEVLDTCPVPWSVRTLGHLGSAWLPLAVAAGFVAAVIAGTAWQGELVHGPIGVDDGFDVIAALLLPVGGVALGVALGRWFRSTLVPVVAVIGIAFATTGINGIGGQDWNAYTALTTAPTIEGPSPVFTDRPAGFHLLWIAGLILLVVVAAVVRDRRTRPVLFTGIAAVVVVALAGFGATRPVSDGSARHIADLVAQPEDHQVCLAATDRLEVCTFGHHRDLLAPFTSLVTPVAEALPAPAGSFTLRHRYLGDLADLPPEVRSLLDGVDLDRRPSNEIAVPEVDDVSFDPLGTPMIVGLGVVGLPTAPDDHGLPEVVAGQARGVVALWLAVRGVAPERRAVVLTAREPASPDPYDRGLPRSADHTCAVPSVVWSAQDLAAARAIVARPDGELAGVLAADWARWTDPSVTTDELLAALGLAPMGPYDQPEPRPADTC